MTFNKSFLIYLLCLSLSIVSGCVSSRNTTRNENGVSVASGGNSVNAERENSANSVSEQKKDNTNQSNQSKANASAGEVSSVKEAAFAHLKPEYAAALKAWMVQNKEWEPAQEKDYKRELLEYAKQDKSRKNYHPYYAVGDFSRDGKEDFGVGLVDSKTRKKLAFAVFNYPFSGKAAFFTDKTERDDIIIYNNGYLYVGADYSDSGYGLEPDGDKYKVTSLFDDEP